jgi:hypothetical protein
MLSSNVKRPNTLKYYLCPKVPILKYWKSLQSMMTIYFPIDKAPLPSFLGNGMVKFFHNCKIKIIFKNKKNLNMI